MLYLYNSATDDLSALIAEAFGSGPLCREAFVGHLHPFLHRISSSKTTPRMLVIGDSSGGYALLGAVYGFEVRWFTLTQRAIKRPDANMGDGSLEIFTRSITADEPPSDVVIIRLEAATQWPSLANIDPETWLGKDGLLCIEKSEHSHRLQTVIPNTPKVVFQARGFRWRRSTRDKGYRMQRTLDAIYRILPFSAAQSTLEIYDSF